MKIGQGKFAQLLISFFIISLLSGCSSNTLSDHDLKNTQSNYEEQLELDASNGDIANTIKTDYFSIEVPNNWIGYYSYGENSVDEDGSQSLFVDMVSKSEYGNAHLFALHIIPITDIENVKVALDGLTNPIGLLSTDTDETYFLGFSYASEMACTENEEKKFLELIDSVPSVIENLTPSKEYQLRKWDGSLEEEIRLSAPDAPYVPISFNYLGADFETYVNQISDVVYELKDMDGFKKGYHINTPENVKYYYGGNNVLVGTENDKIVLYSFYPAAVINNNSSPSVRDVISFIGAADLFEVTPQKASVDNAAVSFYYWKIDDGYIGFVTVGGNEPENCYDYTAQQFVVYNEQSLLNIY